ncbi:MAG: helicase, partial [Thermocrispum sp.]
MFEHGACSCPVGANCKHVVALVLTATGGAEPTPADRPKRQAWERSLGELLELPGSASPGRTPIAVELTVSRTVYGSPPRVAARLVRPGKRGGWVAGDLSWSSIGAFRHFGGYLDSHVRVLQELYALSQAGGPSHLYGYYGDQKSIDLTAFDSGQLWPMLEHATAIGVRLVHGKQRLGEVRLAGTAELSLDVARDERSGGQTVTPVLSVDGADPRAISFIGVDGHGMVFTDRAEAAAAADPREWPLRLAQLTKPVPPQLQRMVLEQGRLDVPAAGQARFRDEFYPRLRHIAPVGSSDGSFTPPEISDPALVLHAAFGAGHDLDLSWAWVYDVGQSRLRIPVDPPAQGTPGDGVRDPVAEQAVVDGLDVSLAEFGLITAGPGRRPVPRAQLRGIDTMRFSTEVLPLLTDAPGVVVEVSGQQPDYREAGDSLRVALSTDAVGGESDWFDLGVSITVEGREVPFAEVFSALARDESHLLLADGAFFSLQKPELQSLRRLIEEARSLQDAPGGPLRLSRFQAGLWQELSRLGVVERQAEAWQRQVDGLLSAGSLDPPPVPATVEAELRPYQADGFGWLEFLWRHGLG